MNTNNKIAHMKRSTLMLCFAMLLPMFGMAQRHIGIATSNWSGTNGLYLNPANIGDSRHKFVIDLFSVDFGVNNNLAKFNSGSIIDYAQDPDNNDLADAFEFQNNDKFSLMAPYAEIHLPGLIYSINRKHSLALTSRVRVMSQFNDFNQNLYRTIIDRDFVDSMGANYTVSSGPFNFTAHGWSEIGLSWGGVLYDGGEHFIKGGITLRYLMGAGYLGMNSNRGIDAVSYGGQDSVQINNSDLNFGTTLANNNSSFGNSIGDFLFNSAGNGVGGDVGFVYEWRPDHAKYKYDMDCKTGLIDDGANKYKLRVSLSVTDMGAITYKGSNNFTMNITGSGYVKGNTLGDSVSNYDDLRAYAVNHGFTVDSSTGATTTKVKLPTSLIFGLDYNVAKNFYVNAMYINNLANRSGFGNSYYNQITVTPRYDIRAVSVGVPLSYSFLTKSLKAGVGVRAGGFFIGSDDIGAMFSSAQGFNFYFGAYIPINKKKLKDDDKDGVSNKKDKCKNEKGICELEGCPNPDKDGDGIVDKEDKCPDVAGIPSAMGCPDSDLDSVADAQDRCPQEAGSVAMQGCPDRDRDGVADIDDQCPDLAGLAQYGGCPDTDGDGLADNKDECPEAAGPPANQGCPDSDNDGVADNKDKCPEVPGTVENYGCPEVAVEVKKRLAFAATAIQFDLGKATIKPQSYKLLNEIVGILNDYSDYYMTIDGHTDNTGTEERNLELSKERAASVRQYFIDKGINAERLESNGYGESQPKYPNNTAANRAKNRRVEMDLKLR